MFNDTSKHTLEENNPDTIGKWNEWSLTLFEPDLNKQKKKKHKKIYTFIYKYRQIILVVIFSL